MKAEMPRLNRLPLVHLTALFLEYVLAGWLLSAYNVAWLTWVGTQAVTLHLAMVGFDAVALAVAWIVGIMWAGAFTYAWPKSIPWVGVAGWAAALALSWILGLVLILNLAKAHRAMKAIGFSKTQAFLILVIVTWVGLGIGRIVNTKFMLGLSN